MDDNIKLLFLFIWSSVLTTFHFLISEKIKKDCNTNKNAERSNRSLLVIGSVFLTTCLTLFYLKTSKNHGDTSCSLNITNSNFIMAMFTILNILILVLSIVIIATCKSTKDYVIPLIIFSSLSLIFPIIKIATKLKK